MFHNGQIVFDCERQEPCAAYTSEARRETHFIKADGFFKYEIACPATVEEAKEQMKMGIIFPAPLPTTHCHKCFNWKSNHSADGSCWKRSVK